MNLQGTAQRHSKV